MENSTQKDQAEEQAVVMLRCLGRDDGAPLHGKEPIATGFYVTLAGKDYLVTNLHVVTGKHPMNGELIGPYEPRQIIVHEIDGRPAYTFNLYTSQENPKPRWFESSRNTQFEGKPSKIDVAVIPIGNPFQKIELTGTTVKFGPIEHALVVGYPFVRARPIWKTCHVAETVQPNPDYFLINGRTTKGMSGSPVYRPVFSWQDKLLCGYLGGVYSGRYADDDVLTNLDIGIVWKARIIKEIIEENEQQSSVHVQ